MPPKINHSKCDLCGKCIFQCGKYVFEADLDKEKILYRNAKRCIDCFICMLICPNEAISIVRSKT